MSSLNLGETMVTYSPRTKKDLQEVAESLSCELILPRPDQLQLDLDTAEGIKQYETYRDDVGEKYDGIIGEEEWHSRHGKRHVVLTLGRTPSSLERIALQAILGSDPRRELLALHYLNEGCEVVSCLFKPNALKVVESVYDADPLDLGGL